MKLEALTSQVGYIDKMEGAKRTSFGVDNIDFLMDMVISKLYQDVPKAIVREIISNAIDSHRKAGASRKVRVTIPTELDPVFVVKDFGTGMSREDIEEIYLQIGASSKRNNEGQIGGWGLGAKSPLAYGDFQIEAVKNGMKVSAFAYRDPERKLKFTYVEEATNDETGVEVRIPIHLDDVQRFVRHISFYSAFFDETVEVIGQRTENIVLKRVPAIDKDYMRGRVRLYYAEDQYSSEHLTTLMTLIDSFEGLYHFGDTEDDQEVLLGVSGIPYGDVSRGTTIWAERRNYVFINFENNPHLRPTPNREGLVETEELRLIKNFLGRFGDRRSSRSIRTQVLIKEMELVSDPEERLKLLKKSGMDFSFTEKGELVGEEEHALFESDKQPYISLDSERRRSDYKLLRIPRLVNGEMRMLAKDALVFSREFMNRFWGKGTDVWIGEETSFKVGTYQLCSRFRKLPKVVSTVGWVRRFVDLKVKVSESLTEISYEFLPDEHPAMFEPYRGKFAPRWAEINTPIAYRVLLFPTKKGYDKFLKHHQLTREEHVSLWARRAFVWHVRQGLGKTAFSTLQHLSEEECLELKARVLIRANQAFHSRTPDKDWIDVLIFWHWICEQTADPLGMMPLWAHRDYQKLGGQILDYLRENKINPDCSSSETHLIPFTEDLRWVLESINEVFDGNSELGIEPWWCESD